MKQHLFLSGFAFLLFLNFSNAQTVDQWAQDGKMVFQFRPELNISLPMIDKDYVDIHSSSYFLPMIQEFGIVSVRRLHPDIRDEKLLNTYQIEFDEIHKIYQLISIFQSYDEIEYAEPRTLHKSFFNPNDQYYNNSYQYGLFKINAAQAWDISQGSASIVVAVADNAILTTHPDLTNNMVPGRDVAMNDNNPNPSGQASGSHGTHVSGIVGAQTNNSIGIASIGFNTSVMPIKIARDSDGALTAGYEGIAWAANNGAHVINMSWGGGGYSTYGQNVINNAWNQGAILVAAAGNDGNQSVFYPAGYNNVISVASTNSNDTKSSFSNYGTWITVSAPGNQIFSTVTGNSYNSLSGTSMASPLVAGLAGLMKSVNPALPNPDLINCLTTSCDNINSANPSYVGLLGAGRINAYAAMQCMQATTVDVDAGIINIIQPYGTVCDADITPVVVLKNFGMLNLTTVKIRYQVDAGTIQTYNWSGNLSVGQVANVTLPVISPSAGGHSFRAFTQDPNNDTDENPANDEWQTSFTIFTSGVTLPFTETFESNSFATNNWTVINPDGDITWDIVNISGTTPGNKAARMNFYNYPSIGQRDALVTPPLNLLSYADAELTFKHAYRRYNSNSTDSLIISVSTDCGTTFQRVMVLGENGTGIFATGYTSTSTFAPSSSDDWCSGPVGSECKVIDLTPFVGYASVVVKFEAFNSYSNNLYLDNINITGSPLTTAPAVQITSSATSICQGNNVTFTDMSAPAVTSRQWTFAGGSPSTSVNSSEIVNYNTTGTWDVTLEAVNGFGSSTQTFTGYITVYPQPAQQNIQQNGGLLSVTLQTGETVQWYRNGNFISGANQPSYQVTQIGNYKARITSLQGCYMFTDEVTVNPTGIEEREFESNSMFVFPNPASDEVYVFLENMVTQSTQVEITDLAGKTVASYTILPGDQKILINVAHLPQGAYMISLKGKKYTKATGLLIAR
jgi:PKD repeat protein